MFNMIFDVGLVILFFITFKMYDIYVATIAIICGSITQIAITRMFFKRFDKKQLIVLAILIVFGGMTLYFHNPIFIKWKPTIVFWLMACIFLLNHWLGKKPIPQQMMSHVLEDKQQTISPTIWKRLSFAWIIFFILLGGINIYIAYYYSTNAWVNFKLYGILGALLGFGILQSFYLSRYLNGEAKTHSYDTKTRD